LFLIVGLRPIGIDNDSIAYHNAIKSLVENNFTNLNFYLFEPSFHIIAFLSYKIYSLTNISSTTRIVLIIYAFLAIIIKVFNIYKQSDYPYFSLYIYITLFLFLQEFTQIRAALATSIFLYSIPFLVNKSYTKYLLLIFIASFFHYSALIALPLLFIDNKKFNYTFYIIFPFLGIMLAFIPIDIIDNIFKTIINFLNNPIILNKFYYSFKDSIVNDNTIVVLFNRKLYFALYFIFIAITLFLKKYKNEIDNSTITFLKIYSLSLFLGFTFALSKNLSLRIPEFYLVITILFFPKILDYIKNDKLKTIYIIAITVFASVVLIFDYIYIRNIIHFNFILKYF